MKLHDAPTSQALSGGGAAVSSRNKANLLSAQRQQQYSSHCTSSVLAHWGMWPLCPARRACLHRPLV